MALLMLDLDNTLVDRQAAFEHWRETKGSGNAGFERERHAIEESDADGCRPRVEFLAAVRTRLALPETVHELLAEYRHLMTAGLPPVPAATLARLDRARANGMRIAIVTNGDAEAQRAKAEAAGLPAHVDAIVISGPSASPSRRGASSSLPRPRSAPPSPARG